MIIRVIHEQMVAYMAQMVYVQCVIAYQYQQQLLYHILLLCTVYSLLLYLDAFVLVPMANHYLKFEI